jgi:putative DNA primase/helicase
VHRDIWPDTARESSSVRSARRPVDLNDTDLIEKAKTAANGAKFSRLWAGDDSEYGSQSEADLALCCMLAFWTGGDAGRVDALFRSSGLYRKKWDDRHFGDGRTYGQSTVEEALKRTSEYYSPPLVGTVIGRIGMGEAAEAGEPEKVRVSTRSRASQAPLVRRCSNGLRSRKVSRSSPNRWTATRTC